MTALLLVSVPFVFGAFDPATIAQQTTAWRMQHEREILAEFSDLLALPNLASDAPGIRRNADLIRGMLEKRGLTTRLLTLEGAPPIVVGDLGAPGAHRTIAFYAHYDGQPVDPAKWKSDPWKPVMRDATGKDVDWQKAKEIDPEWRLYARSAGDDVSVRRRACGGRVRCQTPLTVKGKACRIRADSSTGREGAYARAKPRATRAVWSTRHTE